MNLANHIGAREREQFVIALDIAAVRGKARAAIVRLSEFVLLNHRAHRAIKYDNALGENLGQVLCAGIGARCECGVHKVPINNGTAQVYACPVIVSNLSIAFYAIVTACSKVKRGPRG